MADFIPVAQLKKLSSGDIMTERDLSFRPDLEEKKKAKEVKLDVLTVPSPS